MDSDTETLIASTPWGIPKEIDDLLQQYRPRLLRMVAMRMDHRVAGRFDPSDVVQETLIEVTRRLDEYSRNRTVPFYVWLRQVAIDRLLDLYRRHLRTKTRSVLRESPTWTEVSSQFSERFVGSDTNPCERLSRQEIRLQVNEGLRNLKSDDRELLLMRYSEQKSVPEIAAVLNVHINAVKSRLRRALERLHDQLHSVRGDYEQ